MKDDGLFWYFDDFFAHFPPGHQLTMVAKHAFNPEYAVNFGPASGGAYLSEAVGTKLEESYNNEITRSSAHFNLIPKGRSFLGSTESTYNVGDNGWEKDGAVRLCCMNRVYDVETL